MGGICAKRAVPTPDAAVDDEDQDPVDDWPETACPAIGHSKMLGKRRGVTTSLPSFSDVDAATDGDNNDGAD